MVSNAARRARSGPGASAHSRAATAGHDDPGGLQRRAASHWRPVPIGELRRRSGLWNVRWRAPTITGNTAERQPDFVLGRMLNCVNPRPIGDYPIQSEKVW